MQPLITYMQHMTAGDVLAYGGILSLIGLGLWAASEFISRMTKLYCDLAGQRAKERDNG